MPVYLIIDIQVHDQKKYLEYIEKAKPVLEKFGGRYLARGSEITTIAGDWHPERIVLVEFESMAQLKASFACPEYKAIAHLRTESTKSRTIIVEGYEEEL